MKRNHLVVTLLCIASVTGDAVEQFVTMSANQNILRYLQTSTVPASSSVIEDVSGTAGAGIAVATISFNGDLYYGTITPTTGTLRDIVVKKYNLQSAATSIVATIPNLDGANLPDVYPAFGRVYITIRGSIQGNPYHSTYEGPCGYGVFPPNPQPKSELDGFANNIGWTDLTILQDQAGNNLYSWNGAGAPQLLNFPAQGAAGAYSVWRGNISTLTKDTLVLEPTGACGAPAAATSVTITGLPTTPTGGLEEVLSFSDSSNYFILNNAQNTEADLYVLPGNSTVAVRLAVQQPPLSTADSAYQMYTSGGKRTAFYPCGSGYFDYCYWNGDSATRLNLHLKDGHPETTQRTFLGISKSQCKVYYSIFVNGGTTEFKRADLTGSTVDNMFTTTDEVKAVSPNVESTQEQNAYFATFAKCKGTPCGPLDSDPLLCNVQGPGLPLASLSTPAPGPAPSPQPSPPAPAGLPSPSSPRSPITSPTAGGVIASSPTSNDLPLIIGVIAGALLLCGALLVLGIVLYLCSRGDGTLREYKQSPSTSPTYDSTADLWDTRTRATGTYDDTQTYAPTYTENTNTYYR